MLTESGKPVHHHYKDMSLEDIYQEQLQYWPDSPDLCMTIAKLVYRITQYWLKEFAKYGCDCMCEECNKDV